MEITARKEGDVQVVEVTGRMDAVSAPEFDKRLSELVDQGEKRFVVNFSQLGYISSAGLRSVLAMAKKLKAGNGELSFTGLKGPVEEVFRISGFLTIFRIFDSEESALRQV